MSRLLNFIKQTIMNRYIIQLSIVKDSWMYNFWDYTETVATLEEAEAICDGLYDKSVHKLQIADLQENVVLKVWETN